MKTRSDGIRYIFLGYVVAFGEAFDGNKLRYFQSRLSKVHNNSADSV